MLETTLLLFFIYCNSELKQKEQMKVHNVQKRFLIQVTYFSVLFSNTHD